MRMNLKAVTLNLVALCFAVGCQTTPKLTKKYSFREANKDLLKEIYRSPSTISEGKVSYELVSDYSIKLTRNESIKTDLFLPNIRGTSPLVIISHGNKSYKEAHFKQAQRLASWGFHVLTLQLPNRKQWIQNGKRIEKLVRTLHANPLLLSQKIDTRTIVLVGHSFGGSAVSVAAGSGAPISGLILLDPAVVHRRIRSYLAKVKVPTFLIGADKKVFLSKRRNWFGKYVSGEFNELSIYKSTHNDAQYPSLPSLNQMGFDSTTEQSKQELFLKNILLGSSLIAKDHSLRKLSLFLSKQEKLGIIKIHNSGTSENQFSLRQNRSTH